MAKPTALEHDFEDSVGYWICDASHRLQLAINAELAPQGITYRQAQILASLAIAGPLSQIILANRMNIEAASLVPVLDRMEREGLVARQQSESDRRVRLIHVLPKAKTMWQKIVQASLRVRVRATAGMSDREIAQLGKLLARLRENLSREQAEGCESNVHGTREKETPTRRAARRKKGS